MRKTRVPMKNGVYAFLAYWKILADKKLPQPVREYQFAKPRKWAFDLAWPSMAYKEFSLNGWMQWLAKPSVAVEIEGGLYIQGGHSRGAAYEKNLEKYNAAVSLNWRLFRFSPGMLERSPAACIKQVEEALR